MSIYADYLVILINYYSDTIDRYIDDQFLTTEKRMQMIYYISLELLISFIIGIAIGLLMGYSDKVNKLLNPLVYFTYPIPKMALLPIVMTIFGLGDGSKITMIVLITVFHVIVSVRDAVVNVSKETYNPLISLGATKLQRFNHVTFPAILPEILTNVRLCIGTAFSVLFFSEAYGTIK